MVGNDGFLDEGFTVVVVVVVVVFFFFRSFDNTNLGQLIGCFEMNTSFGQQNESNSTDF